MLLSRHRVKKPIIEEIQVIEQMQAEEVIDYESMTKAEIVEALEKAEIEHDARQKKESLIELLKAGK